MDCPQCASAVNMVVDTRKESRVVCRVRKCKKCKHVWKTEEKTVSS